MEHTLRFNVLLIVILFWLLDWTLSAQVESETPAPQRKKVVGMFLEGNPRTNIKWLRTYLNLEFPIMLSDEDLIRLKSKILTTEVFTDAHLSFSPYGQGEVSLLSIKLDEKWTTIPVVRGAYGGGTPLSVLGVYNTHSFGRLWTLGAEAQRYGSAPWGGVVWARHPRFLDGYHEVGFEYWRQFRLRRIYDDSGEKTGDLRSDYSKSRLLLMTPLKGFASDLKFGLDLQYRIEQPATFHPVDRERPPERIEMSHEETRTWSPKLRLIYDDMQVDNLYYEGFRFVLSGGPSWENANSHSSGEFEVFLYQRFPENRLNLGAHLMIGQTTSHSLESQYFLGGFESIRGLPDGYLYGTRAFYSNVELRHLMARYRYAWIQPVVFADLGSAGDQWSSVRDQIKSSAGIGIRIAVPQIYRLMLRVDYAWSLEDPKVNGITAGMNQFFQPYKPL